MSKTARCQRCDYTFAVPDFINTTTPFKTCHNCRTPEENERRKNAIAKYMGEKTKPAPRMVSRVLDL